jgi:hypothetical protein
MLSATVQIAVLIEARVKKKSWVRFQTANVIILIWSCVSADKSSTEPLVCNMAAGGTLQSRFNRIGVIRPLKALEVQLLSIGDAVKQKLLYTDKGRDYDTDRGLSNPHCRILLPSSDIFITN